ncbi:hypothetical protein LCGC14_1458700 [marine sediment metagenome]|uniref:Uncharacterized protein n=1 Tax=marine sediment metagenome TaxID=412755 RepID=A0A0F9MHP1_9ZZZZ
MADSIRQPQSGELCPCGQGVVPKSIGYIADNACIGCGRVPEESMDKLKNMLSGVANVPIVGVHKSKDQLIMEAAARFGRDLRCAYCDANHVQPVPDKYLFRCTKCKAEWSTRGKELRGPHADGAEPDAPAPEAAPPPPDRYMTLEDDD